MNAVLDMVSQHHEEPSDCVYNSIIMCFQSSEFVSTPILHSIQQKYSRWLGCVL